MGHYLQTPATPTHSSRSLFDWSIFITLPCLCTYVGWTTFNKYWTSEEVDNHCYCAVCAANTVTRQIALYRSEHNDTLPSLDRFWDQMTKPTNLAGQTTDAFVSKDFPLGPYLQVAPISPANGRSTIGTSPSPAVGWVYTVKGNKFKFQPIDETGNDIYTNRHHPPAHFQ